MRKTARGRSVVGVALLLFILSYVLGTVAPALVGLLLLAYVAWAHLRFRDQLDRLRVHVERMPTTGTFFQEEPATLRTRLVVAPAALHVTAKEALPADVERVETRLDAEPGPRGSQPYVLVSRVTPRRRGPHRLRGLAVTVGDGEGLWEQPVRVEASLDLVVQAPRAAFEAGAAVRDLRDLVLPRHTDPGEWSEEIMAHRSYVPGDPTRSIDWRASSKRSDGGLLSRIYMRELERPLVVLLDASRTMRHKGPGPSMLDEGARFASAVLGASWSQAKPAGFVAFDEYRLLDYLEPGKRPELAKSFSEKLARLAPAIPLPRDANVVDGHGLEPNEVSGSDRTPFERVLAPFLGGARSGHLRLGLHEALVAATRGGSPAFIVAFTDLRHRTQEALNALARAQKHQHRVLAVVPFPPWFRLAPGTPPTAEGLESLYREWERHRKVERRLRAAGIEVVEASPEQDIRDLLHAAIARGRPRT